MSMFLFGIIIQKDAYVLVINLKYINLITAGNYEETNIVHTLRIEECGKLQNLLPEKEMIRVSNLLWLVHKSTAETSPK